MDRTRHHALPKKLLLSPIYVKRELLGQKPAKAECPVREIAHQTPEGSSEICTQTSKTIMQLAKQDEELEEIKRKLRSSSEILIECGQNAQEEDVEGDTEVEVEVETEPDTETEKAENVEAQKPPLTVYKSQALKSQSFVEPSNMAARRRNRLHHFTKPPAEQFNLTSAANQFSAQHAVKLTAHACLSEHAGRRKNSFVFPAEPEEVKYMIDYPGEEKVASTEVHLPVNNANSLSTLFLSSEGGLCSIMNRVKSLDWSISLKGLAEIVDLAIICDVELLLPVMPGVNHKLLEMLKSPRSHVSRSACQIAGQLFETVKDTRRPEFDDIVYVLLSKTADANKFIRHDANVALDSMVTHVPIFHSVRAICSKGPSHRNPLVRCASVRLLICAVVMAGPDAVLNSAANEPTRKRLLWNLASFLEDKSLETRRYGERLYRILEKQGNLEFYMKKYLEREKLEFVSRVLKNIQKTG